VKARPRLPGAVWAALGVFVVALAARLLWVSFVENPYDDISSDMAGYINRALQLAYGGTNPLPVFGDTHVLDAHAAAAVSAGVDPWAANCPLYPPGTHMIYAAEMKLAGWSHHGALLFLNCLWGAVVAPCALLLALRIVPKLKVAIAVGLFVALWYPLLAFCGFFSSEQPYAGAIAISAWLLVRLVKSARGSVGVGVASSIAYLVRPQIILTLVLLAAIALAILWRQRARGRRLPLGRIAVAGAVLAATVGWGAVRYHHLSGRWGLVSDNGTMTRLWADTSYGRIRAIWHAPDGTPMSFMFESPPKAETGEHRQLDFEGYIGDTRIIDQARRNEVHYMSFGERVVRWVRNVRLLFVDDTLWPDSPHEGVRWRGAWYTASHWALLGLIAPLAALGILSTARAPSTVLVVCAAHVLTMLVVAAFFYAEQRYRVPYDMFLVLLALEGARRAWRFFSAAWDRVLPGRRPSPAAVTALVIFLVALGARLVWVACVDSPYDNIVSDMGGYINRARQAAFGNGDPYPIFATLYPPGAHLVYAAEMKLVGFDHHAPMLFLNCMWGAVVAPCSMLLALRIVPRPWIATAIGVFMALWYPLLAFCGFFSSEQPYAGALALSAWLLVRHVESGKSAIALGVASAVAYLIRPQIILTLTAFAAIGLVILLREPLGRFLAVLRRMRAPSLHLWRLVLAGSILTAAVAYGAIRYHSLCGRWGLISDNAAMTRLWADTNYGKVRSKQGFFFASPPKGEIGENRELVVDGYVGDPVVLDRARRNEVNYMSTRDRVVRWISNVQLLFVKNELWPDSSHQGNGWRRSWYQASQGFLLYALCPLAVLGLLSCARRPRLVPVVCALHVITMLVVAAFFFAENRYRVPYDIFILVLAVEGARVAVTAVRAGVSRLIG